MNGTEWAKSMGHGLVSLDQGHCGTESAEGDTEEFLHDLKTNCPVAGVQSIDDQAGRHELPNWVFSASFVDEDVGIEKEASAHSFRRGYRDRLDQCV